MDVGAKLRVPIKLFGISRTFIAPAGSILGPQVFRKVQNATVRGLTLERAVDFSTFEYYLFTGTSISARTTPAHLLDISGDHKFLYRVY